MVENKPPVLHGVFKQLNMTTDRVWTPVLGGTIFSLCCPAEGSMHLLISWTRGWLSKLAHVIAELLLMVIISCKKANDTKSSQIFRFNVKTFVFEAHEQRL